MPRSLLRMLVAAVATALVTLAPAGLRAGASGAVQSPDSRTVTLSVFDRQGAPVPGMTPADFRVRENGRNMTVVAVEPAKTPITLALMIDNSGVGLQAMREGAAAVIRRLNGLASIALYTTSGNTIKVQDFTDSTATLMGALNKVYASSREGSQLTDGIVAVTREFETAEAKRPAIISIGVEGRDFSQVQDKDVYAALQRSGARLYMVRLGAPVLAESQRFSQETPQTPAIDEAAQYFHQNRADGWLEEQVRFNAVLGQAPGRTGGRLEQVSAHTGIPTVVDGIAVELATQYEVTYSGANLAGRDLRFEVSTSKRDVRVRGPQRIGPPK